MDFKHKTIKKLARSIFGLALLLLPPFSSLWADQSSPDTLFYQGRLLDDSGKALNGNYDFRFSLWSDADWDGADELVTGEIDINAIGYSGWQESHTVTTDDFGLFAIPLGDVNALVSFNAAEQAFLQIEVNPAGADDTQYEVLDPQGDVLDGNDRLTLHKSAYAHNADTVDNADVGIEEGDLALLGINGVWDIDRIPGGTNVDSFTLDFDAGADLVTLQFGNDTTDATIAFDNTTGDLSFTTPGEDLFLLDNGTLTASDDAGLDFSQADQFRIRESDDPDTLAACTALGELIYDTADNELQQCTTIGEMGNAQWVALVGGGPVDFEEVYATDGDQTLTTSDQNLAIDAGTGNFTVVAQNWSVDDSGNLSSSGTVNSVDLSAIPFSNLAPRLKALVFTPEYSNVAIDQEGGSNQGKMEVFFADEGGVNKRNYYQFTTQQVTQQNMDLVLSIQLPLDFISFDATPLQLLYQTDDGVVGTNHLDISLFDTNGDSVTLVGAVDLANVNWSTADITFNGNPVFTAGENITLRLKLSSDQNGFARVSNLMFNYNGR